MIVSFPLVTGLVPNVTVKPEGKPDAASAILPVNPPVSVTVIVPEAEPQSGTEVGGKIASEKPPAVTVRLIVVVTGFSVPDVPVMVIGYVPATVVEAAVKVATLEVVEEVGLNATLTPVGWPVSVSATLPVNGATSVTVMVSVPLVPAATDRVAAEGLSVKLPCDVPPQAFPLIAKFVGTALVPLQVPLKPMPVTLPPAGMLPL